MFDVYLHTNLPDFTFISSPSFWHKSPSEGNETEEFDVVGLIFDGKATPLFQTNFLPDLTQVYFFPAVTVVAPAFVHVAPALTAANAVVPERRVEKEISKIAKRLIGIVWQLTH